MMRKESRPGVWRCDLHLHSREDPHDVIDHTAQELFATAAARGLQVVALTLHDRWTGGAAWAERAAAAGLLLIPGIEKTVEGRHVLVYNADADVERVRTFADLRAYCRPEMLVMAPHPFYPTRTCLREKLLQHIDLFDAIEFCWLYHPRINWNRMAARVAEGHRLPLVGTSDSHTLDRVGRYYSEVRASPTVDGILNGIRHHRVSVMGSPLSLPDMGVRTVAKAVLYAGRTAWAWAAAGGGANASAA